MVLNFCGELDRTYGIYLYSSTDIFLFNCNYEYTVLDSVFPSWELLLYFQEMASDESRFEPRFGAAKGTPGEMGPRFYVCAAAAAQMRVTEPYKPKVTCCLCSSSINASMLQSASTLTPTYVRAGPRALSRIKVSGTGLLPRLRQGDEKPSSWKAAGLGSRSFSPAKVQATRACLTMHTCTVSQPPGLSVPASSHQTGTAHDKRQPLVTDASDWYGFCIRNSYHHLQ